jgi:hypothetical protein
MNRFLELIGWQKSHDHVPIHRLPALILVPLVVVSGLIAFGLYRLI